LKLFHSENFLNFSKLSYMPQLKIC
jgi:hypothetical protein